MAKFETLKDAAYVYVESFDAIPTDMVLTLINAGVDYNIICNEGYDYEMGLPMWGTMWSFHDNIDNYWLDGEWAEDGEKTGLEIMEDLGFTVIELGDWGYFFGIDGCGFDFYEAYWEPLYKARGLQWHERED